MADREPARIRLRLIRADPDIVICVHRKVDALMACVALRLIEEHFHAVNLLRCERLLVAVLVAIIRRIARKHRPLERRDRLRYAIDVDLRSAERGGEHRAISGNLFQPRTDAIVRVPHLDRIRHGTACLLFKRQRATIPELEHAIRAIDHRRRATSAQLMLHAG